MLRKTLHIVISAMFILSTLGFTISKHYCGNNFINFSVNSQADSCCDRNDGCCHTEYDHFQVQQDFVNSVYSDSFQDIKIDILFPLFFLSLDCKAIELTIPTIGFCESPPPPTIQTNLALLQTYLC